MFKKFFEKLCCISGEQLCCISEKKKSKQTMVQGFPRDTFFLFRLGGKSKKKKHYRTSTTEKVSPATKKKEAKESSLPKKKTLQTEKTKGNCFCWWKGVAFFFLSLGLFSQLLVEDQSRTWHARCQNKLLIVLRHKTEST